MENDYRIVLLETGVCLPRPVFSLAVTLISKGSTPAQIQSEVLFQSGYDLAPEGSIVILKEIAGLEGLPLKDENGNILPQGEQGHAESSSVKVSTTPVRFQDSEEVEPLLCPTDRAESAIEHDISIARRQREQRFGDRAEDAIRMQIEERARIRRREMRRNSEGPLYNVSFSQAGDYELRDWSENNQSRAGSSGTSDGGVSYRDAEVSRAALQQAHERAQALEAEVRADNGEIPIDPALTRPQTPQGGLQQHLRETLVDPPVQASLPNVVRSDGFLYEPLRTHPPNYPRIRFASLTGPPARLGNWPHGTQPRVRGIIHQYELPPAELEGWEPDSPLFEERNEEVDESLATLWP